MSSVSSSEFAAFCDFVVRIHASGASDLTPEQSVEEFRAEQEKLRVWNERNAIAAEQTRQGDYRPLDVEALLARVEDQLTDHGACK